MSDLHTKDIRTCARELSSSLNDGLSATEAERRLLRDGDNILTGQKKRSFILAFLEQFKDFMVIVLLIAAGVSFATELYSGGTFTDSIIIIAIVILNAIIGVIQQSKAAKAIEALKQLTAPLCSVKRNGEYSDIEAARLAVGDVIRLTRGAIVPADCRIIEAHRLTALEASLTGESQPVEKNADIILPLETPLSERSNMLYMGTSIVCGRCEAMVCAVGMQSEMGSVAAMLSSEESDDTPLQKKLNKTGKLLGIGALAICFVIFFVGVLRQMPVFDMFMTSVSLAVAAIPEGLPAIVTIVLAIGTRKMAQQRAVVRRLPAVEALGCASVICSDKTGTITCNKMRAEKISSADVPLTLTLFCLCNDNDGGSENALVLAAEERKLYKTDLDNLYPRVDEFPFDSVLKRMTTLHSFNGKIRCVTKGAPEQVLSLCSYALTQSGVQLMTEQQRKKISDENNAMCADGLRVIAAAYKDTGEVPTSRDYAEYGLIYCGMVGIADPPRDEVYSAVKACKRAGIRPVMITGDNPKTAASVAKRTGILCEGDRVLLGNEIDELSDTELEKAAAECSVYARVTPAHKVRIVKAYKADGNIVAMTGDGINDAPALKAADIGCAMGISGTDVAKSAADIVLTDDNFATIVGAVHEGRNIYENIKKAIHFLLSSNIGEIITIFSALALGYAAPLVPIQLLWVNLVTDSLPAVALGLDSCDEDIMLRPPKKDTSLFSAELWFKICIEGTMIGSLALLSYALGCVVFDNADVGRTMTFAVLSISQLVHAFNMRSEHSLFDINPLDNKYLVGSLAVGVLMQAAVIELPVLSDIFATVPLDSAQWLCTALLCLMPLALVELEKRLSR